MSPDELRGTAREIPRGRLAGFEDDDPPPATFTLPPRPGRTTSPPAEKTPASSVAAPPANRPAVTSAPAAPDADRPATAEPDPPSDGVATAKVSGRRQPAPVRASNIHIPVELLGPFTEAKAEAKMSNGELIITAIEHTYTQLSQLFQPPAAAGGSLFAPRVARPPRSPVEGPVTPLNYRLRPDDYATLDRLVEELGASSRSHLITVALRTYLAEAT